MLEKAGDCWKMGIGKDRLSGQMTSLLRHLKDEKGKVFRDPGKAFPTEGTAS